jgi:hypothetical protein
VELEGRLRQNGDGEGDGKRDEAKGTHGRIVGEAEEEYTPSVNGSSC